MSQEKVELAYRSIDAINRRDLAAYLTLADDDIEAVSRLAPIEGGYHGHCASGGATSAREAKPSKPWGCRRTGQFLELGKAAAFCAFAE